MKPPLLGPKTVHSEVRSWAGTWWKPWTWGRHSFVSFDVYMHEAVEIKAMKLYTNAELDEIQRNAFKYVDAEAETRPHGRKAQ